MLRGIVLLASFTIGGCAHIAEIVDNQTIEHDTIDQTGHLILSMTGDRRLIRTSLDANQQLMVCAETQADAISARSQESSLEAVGKGALSDSIAERLSVTYARTELSDVVRQLAWQLCNANMNGKIGNVAYHMALTDLQDQALRVLLWRANADNTAALNALTAKNESEIAKANTEAEKWRQDREAERKKRVEKLIADCKKLNAGNTEALKTCTV